MKFVFAVALLVSACALAQAADDVCYDNVETACSDRDGLLSESAFSKCNSRILGFNKTEEHVQAYLNLELAKSYEYLKLATYFNSYQKNRPGFQKLYQGLSDRSFDNTIDLIKQVTRRGGSINFNAIFNDQVHTDITVNPDAKDSGKSLKTLDVNELHSLAIALDYEKELTGKAVHVHHFASQHRDPEMAHYIEEKFLQSQAKTVRQLSGYVNDLSKLMKQPDPSLAVFLFDEYLQKQ